ncbi:MAG: substrate-binding domain-containing protein [Pseudomonadota bacterium]
MATLKKIGEELGLSVTTVSRALNGFPEVKETTRKRVRETADRLGYRPNRVAQRLVTGRSGMVGMVLRIKPDMSADQTFFETLLGLTAALAARETDLVLAVDQGTDPILPYQKLLERDVLDGFILNAPVPDDPRVAFLKERGIPFVLHGQDRPEPDYPTYGIDNAAVSGDSVRLLAQLGHRRIALINGDLSAAYAHDRATGFRETMAEFGLDADLTHHGASVESHGYMAALDLLSVASPPTAFICAATPIAAGAMRALRHRGIRVPEDVSVMAHDDALPQTRAISFDPALTVTHAPMRDACVPLAEMLVDHLNGTPAQDLQVIVRADLIIRGSTGPAPERAMPDGP